MSQSAVFTATQPIVVLGQVEQFIDYLVALWVIQSMPNCKKKKRSSSFPTGLLRVPWLLRPVGWLPVWSEPPVAHHGPSTLLSSSQSSWWEAPTLQPMTWLWRQRAPEELAGVVSCWRSGLIAQVLWALPYNHRKLCLKERWWGKSTLTLSSAQPGGECLSPWAPLVLMSALCVFVCIYRSRETSSSQPGLFTHVSALIQTDFQCFFCTHRNFTQTNTNVSLFSTYCKCFLPQAVHVITPWLFALWGSQHIYKPCVTVVNKSFGIFPETESALKIIHGRVVSPGHHFFFEHSIMSLFIPKGNISSSGGVTCSYCM